VRSAGVRPSSFTAKESEVAMKRNRRRQFFIHKDYQTRFIARFAVVTTLWSAAAVYLFTWFAGKRLEETMYSGHLTVASAGQLLLPSAFHAEGIALLAYSFLLAYAIHDLGKKISAPHFMLKRDIVRIGMGDLASPVALRPDDEFQDLAADMENMRKELGRRFSSIKQTHEELALAVSRLDRAFLQGRLLTAHIDEVAVKAARAKEELHAFTR